MQVNIYLIYVVFTTHVINFALFTSDDLSNIYGRNNFDTAPQFSPSVTYFQLLSCIFHIISTTKIINHKDFVKDLN